MALATGFEPVVFSVTGRRVRPGYTTRACVLVVLSFIGTRGGDRTHDLGLMSPTLCQLSYPGRKLPSFLKPGSGIFLVAGGGLEPPISRL